LHIPGALKCKACRKTLRPTHTVETDSGEHYTAHDGAFVGNLKVCGACADKGGDWKNWAKNQTMTHCANCGHELVLELANETKKWLGFSLGGHVGLCLCCFEQLRTK